MVPPTRSPRQCGRDPHIVAIGGGTGLSTLLRGLKAYTSAISAIVTVADDGGSSGRLRRELGVLPPGDLRQCIAALAEDEALMTQLFQYRFPEGGLEGHSFGNLFIAAMAAITGSFEKGILESGHILAIKGRILPATLQDVTLYADLREERQGRLSRVAGESQIPKANGTIERVYLQPDRVRAYPVAVQAILDADLIVIGPGSLYTSILPNLLIEDITQAVRASRAFKVYVCNVATQRGETEGYTVYDHVAALVRHVGPGLVNAVLANENMSLPLPSQSGVEFVQLGPPLGEGVQLMTADLVDPARPWRHDSARLAQALMRLYAPIAENDQKPGF
ncbi:MAG: hypothetical protein C4311_07960 [Chloroflexota bacterium]